MHGWQARTLFALAAVIAAAAAMGMRAPQAKAAVNPAAPLEAPWNSNAPALSPAPAPGPGPGPNTRTHIHHGTLSLALTKIESIDGLRQATYRFDLLNKNGESLLNHQAPYENVIQGFVAARIFEDRVFLFSTHQLTVITKMDNRFTIEKKIALKTIESERIAVAKGSVSQNQRFVVFAEPMPMNEVHPFARARVTAVDWTTGATVSSKIVLGSPAALTYPAVVHPATSH